MISERELFAIEHELCTRVCAASDSGGASLYEAADFATRALGRLLGEYRALQRSHLAAVGEARRELMVV